MLPTNMTVVEIEKPGGPDVLVAAKRPVPSPGAGEILIEVAAAGVNRPDLLQRSGSYPPPPGASDIPGLEVAGRVASLGPDVSGWSVGDKVCALLTGGGYAEYAVAPAPQCLPIPKRLNAVQAAALPETLFTVWYNLFQQARLKTGESLLVHGGSSGIGTIAIQLAKAFGAEVFATARGPEKCAACRALGADRAIDYGIEDFVAVIEEAKGKQGVDVVLDMVGGSYIARNLKCLGEGGRHVSIAFLQGSKVEIDLMPMQIKRLTLTGSRLRPAPIAVKGAIAADLKREVWPLIEAGRVAPVIHATFPLHQAAEAHRMMETGAHIGKVVLTAMDKTA